MATLHIFDFDDTLVDSDAMVHVTKGDGSIVSMSSEEYAKYKPEPEDEFDFSEFEAVDPLRNAEIIEPVFAELRAAIALDGPSNVVILTARSNPNPVEFFLKTNKIKGVSVVATGSSDPVSKAQYILDRIARDDIDEVRVFEDNVRNIRTIKKLITPTGVKLQTNRVSRGKIASVSESFRKISKKWR
jgi:phosphoglycolate phosphatase-like HAD superfamily hydrolase